MGAYSALGLMVGNVIFFAAIYAGTHGLEFGDWIGYLLIPNFLSMAFGFALDHSEEAKKY